MGAACLVCGSPPIETCARCESVLDHQHLAVVDRHGHIRRQLSLCPPCCSTLLVRGEPLTDLFDEVPA